MSGSALAIACLGLLEALAISNEIYLDNTKVAVLGGLSHTIKFGWYGRREETWRYLDGTSRGSLSFSSFANFAGTCATCDGEAQINSSTIHTGDTLGHCVFFLSLMACVAIACGFEEAARADSAVASRVVVIRHGHAADRGGS